MLTAMWKDTFPYLNHYEFAATVTRENLDYNEILFPDSKEYCIFMETFQKLNKYFLFNFKYLNLNIKYFHITF